MTDTQMMVMQLGGMGYSCAQIVLQAALRYMGRDNPDLIRAAAGLAQGGGCAGELCGALSGGLCLLGLHLAKGQNTEQAYEKEQLLYNSLVEWFRAKHSANGKITCDAILGLEAGQTCASMNPELCGLIVSDVIDYAITLLVENGFDPSEGRET